MNTESPLEQALHTYGDELYQTALILSLDPQQAEALLLRAVRALAAQPPAAPGLITLTTALLAGMPAKARPPAKLSWLPSGPDAAVLAQFTKLDAEQRLALDLLLRRDYAPAEVAPLFEHDASRAESALYTALLALAPTVAPDVAASLLQGLDATDECQHTRRMLAVAPGAVFDRGVRAHLATCAACRSAEQAWNRVRGGVEHALRAAFRGIELPATASERIRMALAPRKTTLAAGRMLSPRTLQIGLPLVVLLLVALLVLPRPGPQPSGTGAATGSLLEPRALVQRAVDTLYQPEAGQTAWHGQYHIRWNFSERMYVNLVGDIWTTSEPNRFRAQLVHSEGGAPYEFLLNGGGETMWYANTALYSSSVFGSIGDAYPHQVRLQASPAQLHDIERARLDSGAWGLAGQYLREALAAERLSTWGRQRGTDGAEQMVIGFNGWSPLGFAQDVLNGVQQPTTILLTVDTVAGRLREIREVTGPTGGEQIGRTIWRQVANDQPNPETLPTLFTLERAYNGTGQFVAHAGPDGAADPYLPMVPASSLRPPTDAIATDYGGPFLPTRPPQGTDRAVVIAPNSWEQTTVVYLGAGRLASFNHQNGQIDMAPTKDLLESQYELTVRQTNRVLLIPKVGLAFDLQVKPVLNTDQAGPMTTRINAFGFSRADMVHMADSLVPFTIDQYVANAHFFRSQQPHDPKAFDALLRAAQQQPVANGQARKIVEQTYQRQGPLIDPLPDPYHTAYYAAGSDTTTLEQWTRRQSDQIASFSQLRNTAGQVINQWFDDATHGYWYERTGNFASEYPTMVPPTREPIIEPTWSIINLLGCGGTTLETQADGTQIVTQIDADWYNASCNRPTYGYLLYAQLGGQGIADRAPPQANSNYFYGANNLPLDSGPYLVDVANKPLYNRIFIDTSGRAFRYEVRAEQPKGTLLESIEILEDQRMPAAAAPADFFNGKPPEALFHYGQAQTSNSTSISLNPTREISYTQLITEVASPIWFLPPSDSAVLRRVFVADRSQQNSYNSSDIFDTALRGGIAAQLVYGPPDGDANRFSQEMFIGPVEPFKALLQTQRLWRSSRRILALDVGGQPVDAWEVITNDNKVWTLFERDGSLIAVDASTELRRARLAQFQRLSP